MNKHSDYISKYILRSLTSSIVLKEISRDKTLDSDESLISPLKLTSVESECT